MNKGLKMFKRTRVFIFGLLVCIVPYSKPFIVQIIDRNSREMIYELNVLSSATVGFIKEELCQDTAFCKATEIVSPEKIELWSYRLGELSDDKEIGSCSNLIEGVVVFLVKKLAEVPRASFDSEEQKERSKEQDPKYKEKLKGKKAQKAKVHKKAKAQEAKKAKLLKKCQEIIKLHKIVSQLPSDGPKILMYSYNYEALEEIINMLAPEDSFYDENFYTLLIAMIDEVTSFQPPKETLQFYKDQYYKYAQDGHEFRDIEDEPLSADDVHELMTEFMVASLVNSLDLECKELKRRHEERRSRAPAGVPLDMD